MNTYSCLNKNLCSNPPPIKTTKALQMDKKVTKRPPHCEKVVKRSPILRKINIYIIEESTAYSCPPPPSTAGGHGLEYIIEGGYGNTSEYR